MAGRGRNPRDSRGGYSSSSGSRSHSRSSSSGNWIDDALRPESGGGNGGGKSGKGAERMVARGSNRTMWVIILFGALAILFFMRLFFLQVIVAPEYSARASEGRTIGFAIEPRRGTIYDRNGNILAISVDAITVYANPSEVENPGTTSRQIAEVLGGTPADYMDALAAGKDVTFSFIKRKADVAKAEALRELELPGIYFIEDTRREYPYGKVGGQVIGGVNIEVDEENNSEYYTGASGLELYYNTTLAGTAGYYEAEIGADGTPIPGGVHESKPAVEGQDIVISIDIEFQEEVEKGLEYGIKYAGVKTGTTVVMDAKTGEIYAAASLPLFNPANRTEVKEGAMQLKVISNLLEPGSIFKAVTATAALENNTITPDTEFVCPSYIEADGYIVSDAWERDEVTWPVSTIIAKSSNIGVSMIAEKMGFDKLYNAIMKYHLHDSTGVDYPGEQTGYLLDFDYWSRVQGYNVSFGQGISVTGLQMARFYGALENGGIEVTPHFLIEKPQTGEVPEWPTEKVIDDPKDVEDMVEMLRGVVVEGTGTAADIEGYKVVGKTSTAEIYDEENGGYQLGVYNIAFCGFIDDSSSDLVCYIQADNVPGDRVVTPGFKAIMESAIDRYNITSE